MCIQWLLFSRIYVYSVSVHKVDVVSNKNNTHNLRNTHENGSSFFSFSIFSFTFRLCGICRWRVR
ncbi:hypothetical protein ALT1644_470025 [Alteromonas macleodii]